MNLAIEIEGNELNTFYSLINRESDVYSHYIITNDDLEKIKALRWYLPLKLCDNHSILESCTNNQLITALYFFMDINPASETLMKQWFIDSGCSQQKAGELASIVYNARIIRLHEEIEIVLDDLHLKNQTKYSPSESNFTTVTDILELMQTGKSFVWSFDPLSKYPDLELPVIDLSVIKESKIALEDHQNIILGVTLNYTTFLQFIADEDEILLSQLSGYVEVGLRDKVSIGSVLMAQPQIINDIKATWCSGLTFYGINACGKLTSYGNILDVSRIAVYNPLNEYNLMPLFIKFHKST